MLAGTPILPRWSRACRPGPRCSWTRPPCRSSNRWSAAGLERGCQLASPVASARSAPSSRLAHACSADRQQTQPAATRHETLLAQVTRPAAEVAPQQESDSVAPGPLGPQQENDSVAAQQQRPEHSKTAGARPRAPCAPCASCSPGTRPGARPGARPCAPCGGPCAPCDLWNPWSASAAARTVASKWHAKANVF